MEIQGYDILAQIYESTNSSVYRGFRMADRQAVVLKRLKEDYPTAEQLTRYKQEYEITRNLQFEGVASVFGLEEYQRVPVIVLEDFGGRSLRMIQNERRLAGEERALPLAQFLPIAIQITDILGQIHAVNVIHKDINPSNIVLNVETGQVKIIDFGIATRLSLENTILKNPEILEGTLAYMSPEQTGRMNRFLDYRTDFYSLGATFYELLTGHLPFNSQDALELVHCHIAIPLPPIAAIAGCPPSAVRMLSRMIEKMMAKNAEDRYQSAWGIKADLERCLHLWETTGDIAEFPLGLEDVSDKFQIPQKLYGREAEIDTLLSAFHRVASGTPEGSKTATYATELMLVAGYSGIGKSALVQEIYKPITSKRGNFIAGKFDQYQRDVPYSAVIQAFRQLAKQLLTESEERLAAWKAKLLAALGDNGSVITEVIPEFELILGEQPPVPALGPLEAQNRFNFVFQKFIQVFTQPEHPLVIFIDDLQWADGASLKLLHLLMTDTEGRSLFLIGAYRDNEVNAVHPLMLTLKEIEAAGGRIQSIELKPLELPVINQLIADTLKASPDDTLMLAYLVHSKTGGNPFFLREFLRSLYTEKLLSFSLERHTWEWNLTEIRNSNFTDNVVELMAQQIQKLPPEAQDALKLAACIGNQFGLSTLSIVSQRSPRETALALLDAIAEGLILPLNDIHKAVELDALPQQSPELEVVVDYRFVHDRIQQASYSLIPDESKQVVHQQVGRLLLEKTPPDKLTERIFDIVNQCNQALDLIQPLAEREELAQLNLTAGKKAKASAAYDAALKYLGIGIQLLEDDSWQRQYQLCQALYEEAAEASYLCGNFAQMEELAAAVLQHAQGLLDQVKVYEVKIQAYMAQAQGIKAVQTGVQVLELLGISLNQNPQPADIQAALGETETRLAGRAIADLLHLPPMSDPEKLAAMQILSSLSSATYISAPQMYPLTVCERVKLSLQFGNAPWSAFAYATYGLILCGVINDIERGYQFGQLALEIAAWFNVKEVKVKAFFIVGGMIQHWKDPIRDTLKTLLEGYQAALETGDLEFGAYCACYAGHHLYFAGEELSKLEPTMASYSTALEKMGQFASFQYNEIFRQAVLNLMQDFTPGQSPSQLVGVAYNEIEQIPQHHQGNDRNGLHYLYLNKLILSYWFEEWSQAQENAVQAQTYLDSVVALLCVPTFHFYDSLVQLAVLESLPDAERAQRFAQVAANQAKMQIWAHHAPRNHLHKYELVAAEQHRVLGQTLEAINAYDRAIASAATSGYLHEEGLAYERAAKFYLSQEKTLIARTYLKEASYCYRRWGAIAKVQHLEQQYPQYLDKTPASTESLIKTTISTSSKNSRSGETLDLQTVIRASQTLSQEIVLSHLLETLVAMTCEVSGANRALLILLRDEHPVLKAEGCVEGADLKVEQMEQALETYENCPQSLIQYVARTHENVLIDDTAQPGIFAAVEYVTSGRVQSILCVPVEQQGRINAILYLENSLTPGAFTSDRIELLKILLSQAAISLENAYLVDNLEELVQKRTAEAEQARQEAEKARDLSDQLLVNILPKAVAEELKFTGSYKPIFIPSATVLFTDFKDFTSLAAAMSPSDLVAELETYFSYFDEVVDRYGIEKLKTIGDAYMAVGGVPDQNDTHPEDCIRAALEIAAYMGRLSTLQRDPSRPLFRIRIGIHTGPLVAGVIGKRRFAYDVWGDTVNLASRMEQASEPGRVNISADTYTHVSHLFDCEYRGKITAKGKGELDMYFVNPSCQINLNP